MPYWNQVRSLSLTFLMLLINWCGIGCDDAIAPPPGYPSCRTIRTTVAAASCTPKCCCRRTLLCLSPGQTRRFIALYLSPTALQALQQPRSQNSWPVEILIWPHRFLGPGTWINLHGQSTLTDSQKSYELHLPRKKRILPGYRDKSFFLLGLSQDRGNFHMYFAYTLLQRLGLFFSFFSYLEVRLNDHRQGVSLLLEKPQRALRRHDKRICAVLRRGFRKSFAFKYCRPGWQARIRRHYYRIFRYLQKFQGRALYIRLARTFNLPQYMKWLAFNSWLRNGDYTDEVYWAAIPVTNRRGRTRVYFAYIAGWDYDQWWAPSHGGKVIRYPDGRLSLVYNGENSIDRTIAHDPYLYGRFNAIFQQLLQEEITPDIIRAAMQETARQLQPYWASDCLAQTVKQSTTATSIQKLMRQRLRQLLQRRRSLLHQLK